MTAPGSSPSSASSSQTVSAPGECDHMASELAEAVAARVVELLDARPASLLSLLLTVQDVAARLGASADYVRDHADELGVVRLPGALLRFDAGVIEDLCRAGARCASDRPQRAGSSVAAGVSTARRARRAGAVADLLPIKGRSPA